MRHLRRHRFSSSLLPFATLTALVGAVVAFPGCSSGGSSGPDQERTEGQSDFLSAPPLGGQSSSGLGSSGDKGAGTPPAENAGAGDTAAPERKVEETDLYRLEGDRLYYLNAYRGLMVFDVSNVDQPRLLGRSSIYGSPVEMYVRNGVATIVVADWYGKMDDGTPFHGSIVRGLDATNPANIKVLGESRLGGWVRDTRIVGDVLYAVSEDYGWSYGWDGYADAPAGTAASGSGGTSTSAHGPKVVVSSVSFANGVIARKSAHEFDGYSSIFNVTNASIMLAHDISTDPSQPWSQPSGRSELVYLDISDPLGAINLRGRITVDGSVQGWGTDNGRWNIDFADKRYAHLLGCGGSYCGSQDGQYVLSTVDFQNPDAPVSSSELRIPSTGWSVATRFDGQRMYLSPGNGYSNTNTTPFQVYDLSNPIAPKLAGPPVNVQGTIWSFIPSGDRLFALGNEYGTNANKVSLQYFDVSNAAAPSLIGKSTFGDGWAWTPAAGTFKAFIKDDQQGLVVLPFSGWSPQSYAYQNGVQLIEYSPTAIHTAGAARSQGWVERGIFVKGRIVSLSDQALSVVDYTNHANPKVVKELTLARNVVDARPDGATVAELSTDWWGYDDRQSELRMLPIDNADEHTDASAAPTLKIDGNNAQVFRNGDLSYVVTSVKAEVPCANGGNGGGPALPTSGDGNTPAKCYSAVPQVQVVDLSNGGAKLRGKVSLPIDPNYAGYGWGWYGCFWYDWFGGSDVVQVEGNALAFRRFYPHYRGDGTWDANQKLYVVDITNPDAPNLTSTDINQDSRAWWGNMRAVGGKLYTSHYEWMTYPVYDSQSGQSSAGVVRYYLDQIDLSDRAHPKVGARINVPGLLVGASETDPSLLYFTDYRWWNGTPKDEISVARIQDNRAYLQSTTVLDGWLGNVFVRGNKAYASVQRYENNTGTGPRVALHEFDLTNPRVPVDRQAPGQNGWGWLLGVEGDRAIVTSGWGNGIDVYRLQSNGAPTYDQFVRTQGWAGSLSRQNDQLFLASGYWGVQSIQLQ